MSRTLLAARVGWLPHSRRGLSGRWLGPAALVAAAAAAVLGLGVAPPDRVQGQAQRLMYVHVPSAWTAYCAFGVVALASLVVLLGKGGRRWDAAARAGAELGVGMTALTIVEGSLWGHSAWGVWWTWDPRLVTTALLLVIYLGYLAVRALPGPRLVARRRAAIAGLVCVAWIPVVHMSVLWWRSLHQPPTLLRPDLNAPIAAPMLVALLVALVAFMLGGAWFVLHRVDQLAPQSRPLAVPQPADEPADAVLEESLSL